MAGVAVRRAILHTDSRAGEEAAHAEALHGVESLRSLAGGWTAGTSLLAKLAWLRKREPAALQGTQMLAGGHSFVSMKLCGGAYCDLTTASTLGLLDDGTEDWAVHLLPAMDLPSAILPQLIKGTCVAGTVSSAAGAALRLPLWVGVPVYHGCGDLAATSLGTGCTNPSAAPYAYLGTSGW